MKWSSVVQVCAVAWFLSSWVTNRDEVNPKARSQVVQRSQEAPVAPLTKLTDILEFHFAFGDSEVGRYVGRLGDLNFDQSFLMNTTCNMRDCQLSLEVTVEAHGRKIARRLNISRISEKKGSVRLLDGDRSNDTTILKVLREATFHCVADETVHAASVPQIQQFLTVESGKYFPICEWDTFWVVDALFDEVNSSQPEHNIVIHVSSVSLWKFMLLTQIDSSFSMHESMGTMGKTEVDEMKRIFVETNPYLLAVTFTVSLVHLLFEYLALSNDVQFWQKKRDFEGLSLKTLLINCYFSTVIFLYLLDGETSWTVLGPSGIGVILEFWKLRKVSSLSLVGWKLKFSFNTTYNSTKEHDDKAVKFLLYVMVPCLLSYSVYSAVYDEHKSWYSFLIGTQVRFIYFFGFAMMTPQIFINYKLKSVTHLPWRTFVYKALNTFIDDLFAFVIKMPTLHRLACFRDDIIFLILIYQRWIYPVDKSRSEDSEETKETEKEKIE